jgi:hypothetical protein
MLVRLLDSKSLYAKFCHQILPLAEFEEYPNSASAAAEFVGRI